MKNTLGSAKYFHLLLILMVIVFLLSSLAIMGQINNITQALTVSGTDPGIESAVKVGDGADLYDSDANDINSDVIDDLLEKLFGGNDPSNYVDTYGVDYFGSKVLQSSYINAHIEVNGSETSNPNGLVLKLGGYQWMIASVTKDTTEDEHIVVTLYLADVPTNVKWWVESRASANEKGDNAYCASEVRYVLTTDTAWQLFQNNTANGFAEQYLVQPKYIAYQNMQNYAQIKSGSITNTIGNEALGTPENENYAYHNDVHGCYENGGSWQLGNWTTPQDYSAWGEDYIWIPSAGEVGWENETPNGDYKAFIWGLTNEQRKYSYSPNATNCCWLRSAYFNSYVAAYAIHYEGWHTTGQTKDSQGLRPAIHLNLTAAAVPALKAPSDVTVTYTGESLDLAYAAERGEANWYSSKFENTDIVTVKYLTADGKCPKNQGVYQVEFTINNDKYTWIDTGNARSRTIKFTINPKPLTVRWVDDNDGIPDPTFVGVAAGDTVGCNLTYTRTDGTIAPSTSKPKVVGDYTVTIMSLTNSNYTLSEEAEKSKAFTLYARQIDLPEITRPTTSPYVYTGSNITFNLKYSTEDIEITDFGGMSQYNGSVSVLTAKNVGTYKLKLHLVDPINTVWRDGGTTADKDFDITIEPIEIKLRVVSATNGVITGLMEEDTSVEFELTSLPKSGENITLNIIAKLNDGSGFSDTVYNNLVIDESGYNGCEDDPFTLLLETSKLMFDGEWELEFVVQGEIANYKFTLESPVILNMENESNDGNLTWRLYKGSTYTGNKLSVAIDDVEVKTYSGSVITYYGGEYTFKLASLPSGYKLEGYENNVGENAGTYTTKVTVSGTVYTIRWTIDRAVIDLTPVKWLNDGQIEYNDGKDVSPVIDPDTLPEGLVAAYTGVKVGNYVGEGGRVKVSFSFAEGYENNYILPENGKSGSYKFTASGELTDFEWEKDWDIVPAVIELEWTETQTKDSNDNVFEVAILKDERVDGKVSYVYYESDSRGNIKDITKPLTLSDIVVSSTERKYYVAYPSILSGYDKNYVFAENANDPDDYYSPVFLVGGGSAAVVVTLGKDKYEYSGKSVSLQVSISGAAMQSQLTFTYYKGIVGDATKISVPTEVGDYIVVISSNSSSVVLSGETQFKFQITPSIISTEWNSNALPPILKNLTSLQLTSGVIYEYYDADMHKVEFSDLSAGGTFKIRAVLKDTKNFEFDNGEVETELVTFSVAAGATLRDPSDINNPNYDFDDEDGEETPSKPEIPIEWDTSKNPPELVIPPEYEDILKDIEYEYYDKDGNKLTDEDIANGAEIAGIKVILPDDVADDFAFVDKNGNEVDLSKPLNPYAESSFADKLKEFLQDYWQVIVSGVALVLIIAFTAKGLSYASKRSKIKKQIKKNYTPVYAIALFTAGEKLWNIDYKVWTILAFVLLGVAVLSLIFMILEKSAYKKAKEQLDEAKLEYARNPQAFATAGAAMGAAGAVAQPQYQQPYAEDSRASRKRDREIEHLEEELRKRDEEMRRREEEYRQESRRRDDKKSDREVESLKEEMRRRDEQMREENRRRDEEMKMMFMSMMGGGMNGTGGNAQDSDGNGGNAHPFGYPPFGYPPYGMPYGPYPYGAMGGAGSTNITVDAEHIKTAITETIAALMPSMQAMLPQQASTNEEVVKLLAEEIKATKEEIKIAKEESRKMAEQSQKSEERVEKLIAKLIDKEAQPVAAPASNSEAIEQMLKSQENLMRNQEKLIEKLLEKDGAPTVVAQPTSDKRNDEALEKLAKNQEELAKHVKDLSAKHAEPKIIEKKVEVPIEKIVEVPVEKIVEKVVEKPVEKIVEVPVVKEVPITVEKLVRVPAEKSAKSGAKGIESSERTPRLTIDEAYAKLSKEQKKFFDTLRTYALGKEKCKEKKSTYYILLGQSSVNPLIKLTVKKDTTVALFKMEDEYFKDLRKNSDGTKVKVKETEVIVADQEAFSMAKQMIDLREDQIDRYTEYLKEQRQYKKK